jgi:phosphate transport system permease protein
VSAAGAPALEPRGAAAPRRRDSRASWRVSDRLGLALAWALGLLFCAIAAAIVIFLLLQGIRYVRPSLLVTPPAVGFTESQTGASSTR